VNLVFTRQLLWTALPIMFAGLSYLFWYLCSLCFKNRFASTYKRNSIATFVVFIFMVYPTITNYTFELFNCIEIDDAYYLEMDLTLECWISDHLRILFLGGLPSLVIWVVGFPADIFYILYKHRERLDEKDTLIKYGLFYVALTDKMFYWEIVVINLRKVIFIVTSILLSKSKKIY